MARRYQKGKTSLDLNEARDDEVWGCSGIRWTICKLPVSIRIFFIVVKNVFCVFFILVAFFYVFNVFLFTKRFLSLKNVGKIQSGKQINKKHFQNNSNEIDL